MAGIGRRMTRVKAHRLRRIRSRRLAGLTDILYQSDRGYNSSAFLGASIARLCCQEH